MSSPRNGEPGRSSQEHRSDPAWQLRKYLLLLAILVGTVTYVAGLDPPGGVWLETKNGHRTGNPILPGTRPLRYKLFYYFNATAFAASLVVSILLLFIKHEDAEKKVPAVRFVMVLDVVCLMVAYVAGSCRSGLTTIYASAICAVVILLITTRIPLFAECRWHSAKAEIHSAKVSPSVALGDSLHVEKHFRRVFFLRHSAKCIVMLNSFTWMGMKKLLTWLGMMSSGEEQRRTTDGVPQQQQGAGQLWKKNMLRRKEQRKVLMLLAMFVTTITYTAALSPPGGFWEEAPEDGASHRAGDPILMKRHTKRFLAFFICNTTSFAASLVIITLLLSTRMWKNVGSQVGLYGGNAVALLGLMGAYAAGSGRDKDTTIYVVCLVFLVLVYISFTAILELYWFRSDSDSLTITSSTEESHNDSVSDMSLPTTRSSEGPTSESEEAVDKARSLILLLATLAVTVTYQAGLSPPGGVWRDTGDGHVGGNLILLATHARRYKVFFYCNSAAFITSIVVVIMVQSTRWVSSRALQAAVILDLFGLMGAYASGSCRDARTSIYVFALAAVVFVAVVIYVAVHAVMGNGQYSTATITQAPSPAQAPTPEQAPALAQADITAEAPSPAQAPTPVQAPALAQADITIEAPSPAQAPTPAQAVITADHKEKENEKKRKLLLLLAILAVSITYQAGLTPPGKFWLEHGDAAHHVGDPVLADNYPRRYKAFFYCNATSFMVSVVVIIVLVGRKLSDANKIYWRMLYGSMTVGLIGLMGAYAAGTTRRVKTSVYVFALVGAVLLFAVLHIHALQGWIPGFVPEIGRKLEDWIQKLMPSTEDDKESEGAINDKYRKQYRMNKYLLLLGILAASVTYQAGLDPPGGVWPGDGDGHAAGDPVLHDESRRRYHAFFYSNSTCFVTSVVVVVLLLQSTLIDRANRWPTRAMHTAVVLDLLGLLVAYATGGSRDWGTFGYVLTMAVTVLAYVAIYMVLSYGNRNSCPQQGHEEQINGSASGPVSGTGSNGHLSLPI
ncbi:hypothetical protein EJB05_45089, partial [Eragrostis curvula]